MMDALALLEGLDLRKEREQASLSQRQMAELLNVAQSNVHRMESDPENVSLGDLRKWAEALGYLKPLPSIDAGRPYEQLTEAIRAATRHLALWTEPRPTALPGEIASPEDLINSLRRLARKPRGVIAGRSDSGKSRLINSLLGRNVLPSNYGSSTKLLCILRHVEDRPPELDAEVYLLRDGFDLLSDSAVSLRPFRIKSGGSELTKLHGAHDHQNANVRNADDQIRMLADGFSKQYTRSSYVTESSTDIFAERTIEDARYALIFVDSPILKSCDLIDTPSFSQNRLDLTLAIEALKHSTFLIHCSPATSYMGPDDLILLQEALKYLPAITTPEEGAFANVLLLATMASPNIENEPLEATITEGVAGLSRHLMMTVQDHIEPRLKAAVPVSGSRDETYIELRRRAFPFHVQTPKRRIQALYELKKLVGIILPSRVIPDITSATESLLDQTTSSLSGIQSEIDQMMAHSSLTRQELEILEQEELQRSSLAREHVLRIEALIDSFRVECNVQAKRISETYSDPAIILKMILEHYGQEPTKAGIVAFVMEKVSRDIEAELTTRSEVLRSEITEFIREYGLGIDELQFDNALSLEVLTATQGIKTSGTSSIAKMAGLALGGFLAPGLLLVPIVGIGIIGGALIGGLKSSAPEKLAREVSKILRAENLNRILVNGNEAYWQKIELEFGRACLELDELQRNRMKYFGSDDLKICHDYVTRFGEFVRKTPWLVDYKTAVTGSKLIWDAGASRMPVLRSATAN